MFMYRCLLVQCIKQKHKNKCRTKWYGILVVLESLLIVKEIVKVFEFSNMNFQRHLIEALLQLIETEFEKSSKQNSFIFTVSKTGFNSQ